MKNVRAKTVNSTARPLGFSLIELSLVLVILGLLVGGVLTGQSLIHAAELRSMSVDVSRYRTAALTFRDKYFYWPGDMPNATSFWLIAAGTTGSDNTCYNTWSVNKRTCNGNGDGGIGAFGYTQWESYRFWQHLANAELIEGTYSGVAANATGATMIGCVPGNCPEMRVRNASMIPIYQESLGDTDFVPFPMSNYFLLGNKILNGSVGGMPVGAVVTTAEAWNLDTKLDDGLPYQGYFQTHYRVGSTQWGATETKDCANSAVVAGATYNLTLAGKACAFRIRFLN